MDPDIDAKQELRRKIEESLQENLKDMKRNISCAKRNLFTLFQL